jgi:hypothetical protein
MQFTNLHEQIQNKETSSHELTATNMSLMIRRAPCYSSALKNTTLHYIGLQHEQCKMAAYNRHPNTMSDF